MAQVHTVVLVGYLGKGIGRALVAAAEQHSTQYGVSRLVGPTLTPNADAISFYSQVSLGREGILLSKELTSGAGDARPVAHADRRPRQRGTVRQDLADRADLGHRHRVRRAPQAAAPPGPQGPRRACAALPGPAAADRLTRVTCHALARLGQRVVGLTEATAALEAQIAAIVKDMAPGLVPAGAGLGALTADQILPVFSHPAGSGPRSLSPSCQAPLPSRRPREPSRGSGSAPRRPVAQPRPARHRRHSRAQPPARPGLRRPPVQLRAGTGAHGPSSTSGVTLWPTLLTGCSATEAQQKCHCTPAVWISARARPAGSAA